MLSSFFINFAPTKENLQPYNALHVALSKMRCMPNLRVTEYKSIK